MTHALDCLCVVLLGSSAALALPKGEVVELWPAERLTPSEKPERTDQSTWRQDGTILRTSHVSKPTITVYRPARPVAAAAPAVVICPGGGYGILAWDLEGTEVAAWLNRLGAVGVVLKYRVPRQRDAAFQDAQRAVSLVRSRAGEWGVDPKKIGILGFSAGGHLSARTSTNHKKRSYEPVDEADKASPRPDFAVLIYPAYLAAAKDAGLDAATLPVDASTPPTFLAIGFSDRFTPGSLFYFQALREAKVRSELHVFQSGGHGCGLRPGQTLTSWPVRCEQWLRDLEVLPAQPAANATKP